MTNPRLSYDDVENQRDFIRDDEVLRDDIVGTMYEKMKFTIERQTIDGMDIATLRWLDFNEVAHQVSIHFAFALSIAKWYSLKRMHELKLASIIKGIGASTCGLCWLYLRDKCHNCPIKLDTGRIKCEGTFYARYYAHQYYSLLNVPNKGHNYLKNVAQDMWQYLRNLAINTLGYEPEWEYLVPNELCHNLEITYMTNTQVYIRCPNCRKDNLLLRSSFLDAIQTNDLRGLLCNSCSIEQE